MSKNKITYGPRLRKIRLDQHIGTDLLATRSGVSNAQISRIERNELSPKVSTLLKLAKGLNISKDRMLIISGLMPRHIDLSELINSNIINWGGHPLDKDDWTLIKLWFKNKYQK